MQKTLRTTASLLLVAAFGAPWALAADSQKTGAGHPPQEISVTLFGGACVLKGLADESTLKAIHSINPEKIPPELPASQIKADLETVKKATPLPAALDRYKDRLTHWLETQQRLQQAEEASQTSGKPDAFLAEAKKALSPKKQTELQAMMKRLSEKKKISTWKVSDWEEPQAFVRQEGEPHPQEEFHRALHQLEIKYDCQYEDDEAD